MPLEFLPLNNDDRWLTRQPQTQKPLFGEADGFDGEGRDAEGYDRNGYKPDDEGVNRDREGYDEAGLDASGQDSDGYDEDGYDSDGFNRAGFDCEGYNDEGYNEYGYDPDGYDEDGYNAEGYDRNGYNAEGYNEDGYDEDGYTRNSYDFFNGDPDDYTFYATQEERLKPNLKDGSPHYFSTCSPVKGIPYYGMEIELSSDCTGAEKEIIQDDHGHIVWAKEDCSVEGFEMVTHPMTARWAAENFPWDIVKKLAAHGAHSEVSTNGLHIHVSRAGFDGWAHQFNWLKFFYRNSEKVCELGGRNGQRWGRFNDSDAANHFLWSKTNMKNAHRGHHLWRGSMGYSDGIAYPDRYLAYPDRYLAVNLQNEETMEVRVFASTVNPLRLRSRFELVAASVEYTRQLTVPQIRSGGWEWFAFTSWLYKNQGTYPALESRVVPASVVA